MTGTVVFPGHYTRETASVGRAILGVPTAITAFVGRAAAGPTDDPQMLLSFSEYERRFGGLAVDCPMSYAVRDFFANGGARALVVRVAPEDARAATITLTGGRLDGPLVLDASSVGAWGNRCRATIDPVDPPPDSAPAADETRFDLSVSYLPQAGGAFAVEHFRAVSADPADDRYLPRVLERESARVRVSGDMPTLRPASETGSAPTATNWVAARPGSGSDGSDLRPRDVIGERERNSGLFALERADLFNILCIPPLARDATAIPSTYTAPTPEVYRAALALCVERRAMLVVDPVGTGTASSVGGAVDDAIAGRRALGLDGVAARNAVLYFPRVRMIDPLHDGRVDTFVACGAVAGIMARTDVERGVWKAPAGLDARLRGVVGLEVALDDERIGRLNRLGINCLRSFDGSEPVVWGARTMRGDDTLSDEYTYVPVRRLALFIEESLRRGTRWVVFERNDERLRAQVRREVDAFMQHLFHSGAFQGATPENAWFVRCEGTPQNDAGFGILEVVVGFAALKPAEFVVIRIRHGDGHE